MGRSDLSPLRSLPRVFLPGLDIEQESFELPKHEVEKFRKVLRLEEGDQIGVLPNDGSMFRCEFKEKQAWPLERVFPDSEPSKKVTIAQAFPKGDRLDTVLRMGTELGVSRFILFPAERSVVRWEKDKLADKQRRFQALVQEAAEQSYRTRLPEIVLTDSLAGLLRHVPDALILDESENANNRLQLAQDNVTLVVGPEGGWAPREVELIGDRGITLGKLVLRTDTAGIAAAAAILFA